MVPGCHGNRNKSYLLKKWFNCTRKDIAGMNHSNKFKFSMLIHKEIYCGLNDLFFRIYFLLSLQFFSKYQQKKKSKNVALCVNIEAKL